MTKILLVGDSHLGAVKRAHDANPERYPSFSFAYLGKGGLAKTRFFDVDEAKGSVRIISQGWRKLDFCRSDQDLPNLVVLSLPVNTSRILREMSWRTHVPWRLRQHDNEVALSDGFVDRLIDTDSGYAVEYAAALTEIGLSIAALEAPRFFEDAPYLKRCRLDVIRYIDTLYRQRVVDRLSDLGIGVITQAPQTISEIGSTKMEFDNERPGDVHHANLNYGQIALQQIQDFASQHLGMRTSAPK